MTNLQTFTKALADSDAQVRHFNEQLAQVAGDLADERQPTSAPRCTTSASRSTRSRRSCKNNASKMHTDLGGLRDFTNILVKEQASLNETLAVAPVALANIVHAYQPDLGALGTRSNLDSLADPATLCALLDPA